MSKKQGSSEWTEKWGEPTKPVRLPDSIANAAKAELAEGTPISVVAEKAMQETKVCACQNLLPLSYSRS
ncbi:hypothetical protein ACQ4M3_20845 [Leptolyngbya sp. AN03gr2]|uniref:hypothetical protein n=1 Tax=unclassified Leptolyngbya TaxID=2650499 RepID=UPI003D3130DA